MIESSSSTSFDDTPMVTAEDELLDALPVLAGETAVGHHSTHAALPDERRSGGMVIPAVQAAAVAAGGFVAGAAVVGLVHRRQQRSSALSKGRGSGRAVKKSRRAGALDSRRGAAKAVELVQIVGSRSLLVDVHLLGGSGER
ncbi:MAG TPA: hypothetical protein VK790_11600 [Solirubrobacteraceae bacterium]|nr:hypothetical protein [Solirubrobacteraceae bacterium]